MTALVLGVLSALLMPLSTTGPAVASPASSGPWKQVVAGDDHTCALAADSTVWCWGDKDYGQLGYESGSDTGTPRQVESPDGTGVLSGVVTLAAGRSHTCAVTGTEGTGGSVWCWGANDQGQLGRPTSEDHTSKPQLVQSPNGAGALAGVTGLAAGATHTCAIVEGASGAETSVWCWGDGGKLGNDSDEDSATPVQVQISGGNSLLSVRALTAGYYFTCALVTDAPSEHAGAVWCWGVNDYGSLGSGSVGGVSYTAEQVQGAGGTDNLQGVTELAGYASHTCAVQTLDDSATASTVWCWGYNGQGGLGDGSTDNSSTPVQVHDTSGGNHLSGAVGVVAGDGFTCAFGAPDGAGVVWCWGANYSRQLGNDTSWTSTTPVQVDDPATDGGSLAGVTDMAAGRNHTCALVAEDASSASAFLSCWGDGSYGQRGDGTTTGSSPTPARVLEPGLTALTAAPGSSAAVGEPVTLTATVSPAPDGGTVEFDLGGEPVSGCASVAVDPDAGTASCTTSFDRPTDHTLSAAFSGAGDLLGSTSPSRTYTVTKAHQTVEFTSEAPEDALVGGTYSLAATSSADLPVTFSILESSADVCSLDGDVVTFDAAGTCVVVADQAGDARHLPAAAQQEIPVTAPAPPPAPPTGGPAFPGPVTGQDSDTSTSPTGTATATQGPAAATATGVGTLTVAEYATNPVGAPDFRPAGAWFDVHASDGSQFSTVSIEFTPAGFDSTDPTAGPALTLSWWDGSAWRPVSDQTYDPATGTITITVTLDAGSSPTPVQLTGTVFGVGEVPLLTREAGTNRVHTAIEVSQATYDDAHADAVVLARRDLYADALVGGPFATTKHAPLLLTARTRVNDAVVDEIRRVLPEGGTVYLLGGQASLSAEVADAVTDLGYQVRRLGGHDRYATAKRIANRVPDPKAVLLATGTNFPDALEASAAAAHRHGVVLLTRGAKLPRATRRWLTNHDRLPVWAIGGPAATAAPRATAIAGTNRYDTAVKTASRLFEDPAAVGIANGRRFPDGLTAVTQLGAHDAPLLLTAPNRLVKATAAYLIDHRDGLDAIHLYGGADSISSKTQATAAESTHANAS